MALRISVTRRAELDAQEIYSWLVDYSVQGAQAWFIEYLDAVESLRMFPLRGSMAEETAIRKQPIRQLFFKTKSGRSYRLLYSVSNDEIVVLHVRGPGQRLIGDSGPA
jgi:plasmid stabilization system protein ParE